MCGCKIINYAFVRIIKVSELEILNYPALDLSAFIYSLGDEIRNTKSERITVHIEE